MPTSQRLALATALTLATANFYGCSGLLTFSELGTQPAGHDCSIDTDCATGVCQYGVCAEKDQRCSAANPGGLCPEGKVCQNGRCEVYQGFTAPCSPQAPFGFCPGTQVCDGTACVDPNADFPCDATHPRGVCPHAMVCDNGACITVDTDDICSPTNPTGRCPGPSVCADGACALQDCGNGIVEPTEDCDGNPALHGDFCTDLPGFSGGLLGCNACRFDTTNCSVCGDGFRAASEVCDGADLGGNTCLNQGGFTGGSLSCDTSCHLVTTACTSCGDGARNGNEECEGNDHGTLTCPDVGNFTGGTLTCASDCTVQTDFCTYCGDHARNGNEACEGTDFGGATCVSMGYTAGSLRCTSGCAIDSSACYKCGDDVAGGPEWCDGSDLNGQTCATRGLLGGTLSCAPGCDSFNTTLCGVAHIDVRPSITALGAPAGTSATQQFEAWVIYGDGTEEQVTPVWYCPTPTVGSISSTGLFSSSSTLNAGAQATVVAAYGGDAGALTFTMIPDAPATCGNQTVDGGEECDNSAADPFAGGSCVTRGFSGGTPACHANCSFNASGCTQSTCGNGTITGTEQCDGALLNGQTCVTRGYTGGALACNSNCTFNEAGCSTASNPLASLTQIDLSAEQEGAAPAVCGNSICETGETAAGCGADCKTTSCNNGTCSLSESEAVCSLAGGTDCLGTVRVVVGSNGAPDVTITALGAFSSGPTPRDVTGLMIWTLADADGPPYNTSLGVLNPTTGDLTLGGSAGVITVTAAADSSDTNCSLQGAPTGGTDQCRVLKIEVVLKAAVVATGEPDIILPRPVPASPDTYFTTPCAPVAASQPVVIYPQDGVLFPRNVYQALFQWLVAGNGLFRARFDNDTTDTHVSIFTTADRWRPNADVWRLLTTTNAGGHVTFTVDGVPYTGGAPGACYQTAKYSIEVNFSRADVPGAIYYWSTSIAGIKKASITSSTPLNFIWTDTAPAGAGVGSNYVLTPADSEWHYSGTTTPWRVRDPNMSCVACHAVSRDGKQLALAYKGADELVDYDLSGEVAGVRGQIGYRTQPGLNIKSRYWPTFNDTGDKMVVSFKGTNSVLELRNTAAGSNGALLGAASGVLPIPSFTSALPSATALPSAQFPDWSPDGRWLAFVYNSKANDKGDSKGSVAVIRYDKETYPGLPTAAQQPWNKAPWTAPLVLLDHNTGCVVSGSTCTGGVTGGLSNWSQPTMSPDSLWMVVTRTPEGTSSKDADSALLYAVKWAACQNVGNECVPYPICASTTVAKCGPSGNTACAVCQPINLVKLNGRYSNCDNALSPAYQCPAVPALQNNMPRWAPTSQPDSYFLVFTSHRPYGKVSGEQQTARCKTALPAVSCFTAETKDQLWVAGFDSQSAGGDPSYPPFWLPFQLFSETNHRAYWSNDTSAGTTGCGPEICDGLDNDCDGIVDDGCCAPTTENCGDSIDNDCDGLIDEGCCVPSAEVCDGADNNCNGQVDEGCSGCVPSTEVCDGHDNDCDGLVDTDDPNLVPNAGGTVTCPCKGTEVCDGVDNDCNGTIDDVAPSAYPAGKTCCFPFGSDPCNGVDDDCDGVRDNGCCVPDAPPTEVCDGRDNDCDGMIDEADPDIGPGGCCKDLDGDGYTTCQGDCCDSGGEGAVGCSPANASNIHPGVIEDETLCDNFIDENCDGSDAVCGGG